MKKTKEKRVKDVALLCENCLKNIYIYIYVCIIRTVPYVAPFLDSPHTSDLILANTSSTTLAVVLAISSISSLVVLYGGARRTWSPRTPSTVPVPGYSEMLYGGFMAVSCSFEAMPSSGSKGSLVVLSLTNSICKLLFVSIGFS